MDIAEIRRRVGDKYPPRSKISAEIANGRNGTDLYRATRDERIHTDRITPNAKLEGFRFWEGRQDELGGEI